MNDCVCNCIITNKTVSLSSMELFALDRGIHQREKMANAIAHGEWNLMALHTEQLRLHSRFFPFILRIT